jgi:rhodanese-related sulfurtransferase
VAKDAPIILYCRTGARSNTCSMMLQQAGYTNVQNGINQHHVQKMLAKSE